MKTFKLNKTLISLAVMTLVFMSADVMAQRGQRNFQRPMQGQRMMQNNQNWEPGQRIKAILDLTDEQDQQIKDLRIKHMDETLPIRNEVRELRAKLQTLRTADKADMKAINATIDRIAELRAKQAKLREAHHQDVRTVLTEDQRVIFDNHKPFRRGGKRGGGRGYAQGYCQYGQGQGQGQGQGFGPGMGRNR